MSIDYKEFSIAGVHWVTLTVLTGFGSFKFFFFFFKSFILFYLLAALGLHCCEWAFSSCCKWGVTLQLQGLGFSLLWLEGTQTELPCGMWDLPGPKTESMAPALAGRFLTTGPPGKFWVFQILALLEEYIDLKLYNPWAILFFLSVKKKWEENSLMRFPGIKLNIFKKPWTLHST